MWGPYLQRLLIVSLIALSAGVLSFCSTPAPAGERDLVISWTKPERNCDGTLLTDLAGFRAYWGVARIDIPDPNATTYTTPLLVPGDWWVTMSAYNSQGRESYFTPHLLKTIPATTLKATNSTAYAVVKRTNRFVLAPTGTVPVGTLCDATQSVNGYYAVPRTLVAWSGLIRPDVVVAKCD